MTGMLASVRDVKEAMLVLDAEVDIVDLKQPSQGALGALDHDQVAHIVDMIKGRRPVSATVGDLPMASEPVANAVKVMAATGVDFIKVGFFPGGDWQKITNELSKLTRQDIKIIAVLFADTYPEIETIESLDSAGFTGVMLDTMDKKKGSLSTVMSINEIESFVKKAKQHQLLCGLAGSLRTSDIPGLIELKPDYLGFRGALCNQQMRTEQLDRNSVLNIKSAMTSLKN